MGMIAEIFKTGGKSYSNNGVSANYNKVCIVNVEGPFEPSADAPAVELVKRDRVGNVVCIPLENRGEWTMFGGTFVYTSDSRFSEAVRKLADYDFGFPVALHDRVE